MNQDQVNKIPMILNTLEGVSVQLMKLTQTVKQLQLQRVPNRLNSQNNNINNHIQVGRELHIQEEIQQLTQEISKIFIDQIIKVKQQFKQFKQSCKIINSEQQKQNLYTKQLIFQFQNKLNKKSIQSLPYDNNLNEQKIKEIINNQIMQFKENIQQFNKIIKQQQVQFNSYKNKVDSICSIDFLPTKYLELEIYQNQTRQINKALLQIKQNNHQSQQRYMKTLNQIKLNIEKDNLNKKQSELVQNLQKQQKYQKQQKQQKQQIDAIKRHLLNVEQKMLSIEQKPENTYKLNQKSNLTIENVNKNDETINIIQIISKKQIQIVKNCDNRQFQLVQKLQKMEKQLKNTYNQQLLSIEQKILVLQTFKTETNTQIHKIDAIVFSLHNKLDQYRGDILYQLNQAKNPQTNKVTQQKHQQKSQKNQQRSQNHQTIKNQFVEDQIDKQKMSKKLPKIIKKTNFKQIHQKLKNNQIYFKLTSQPQIKSTKQNLINIQLSQNSHGLWFDSIQINFQQLIKQQFLTVQSLWFNHVKINIDDLKLFILHFHKILPKVKIVRFWHCQLNDIHWKFIIQHLGQLRNLQALILQWNQIQQITQLDLQKLKAINQLKYLEIRDKNLSQQSTNILKRFKSNNQQIQIFFG